MQAKKYYTDILPLVVRDTGKFQIKAKRLAIYSLSSACLPLVLQARSFGSVLENGKGLACEVCPLEVGLPPQ